MKGEKINPYALNIYCDAGMDYDSKNTGGIGYEVRFPESVALDDIKRSIGKFERANIERLELEALLQAMNEVLELFDKYADELRPIRTIIFKTDRFSLNDNDKTSPFRIKEWRKNNWLNYERRPIKNSDLLDRIDKTRKKIYDKTHCSVSIQYVRSKYNKKADKLADQGKTQLTVNENVALHGIKIGKRKFKNDNEIVEVNYALLKEKSEYIVHIYKKEPIRDQWEISAEMCNEKFLGDILKIIVDLEIEKRLHRHHIYLIRIKETCAHHVNIYKTIKEIKKSLKVLNVNNR